jgi:peroxiredoxin Q/BCP
VLQRFNQRRRPSGARSCPYNVGTVRPTTGAGRSSHPGVLSMIKVGMDAPDFSLLGSHGDRFTLSENFGKKRTLLIFYPRDMTPGCRKQLAETSDALEYYRALDTDAFGINQADANSHLRFINDQNLNIDLLIDENFVVSRAYGCMRDSVVKMITRTVIIVGKNGKVIYRAPGSPPLEELLDAVSRASDAPEISSASS